MVGSVYFKMNFEYISFEFRVKFINKPTYFDRPRSSGNRAVEHEETLPYCSFELNFTFTYISYS